MPGQAHAGVISQIPGPAIELWDCSTSVGHVNRDSEVYIPADSESAGQDSPGVEIALRARPRD